MTVYRKTKSNTLVAIAITAFGVMFSTLLIPIIIARLGIEGWAHYSLFLVFVGILSFVETSFQAYVVLLTTRASVSKSRYFPTEDPVIRRTGAYCFGAVVAILILVEAFYTDLRFFVVLCTGFAVVNALIRATSSTYKGVLQGTPSQTRYYLLTLAFNTARPLSLFAYSLFFKTTLIGLCALYCLISLLELVVVRWDVNPLIGTERFKQKKQVESDHTLLWTLSSANLVSVLVANVDKAISLFFANLQVAGEYNIAASIAGLLYLFVNSVISSFTPRFKELHMSDDRTTTRSLFYRLGAINSAFIAICASSFLIHFDFLTGLLHSNIDLAAFRTTFVLLSLAALMSSHLWIPGMISVAFGKPRFSFYSNITTLVVFLAILPIGYSLHPSSPFAWSMAVTASVVTGGFILVFKRFILDFSLTRYLIFSLVLPNAASIALAWGMGQALTRLGLVQLPFLISYVAILAAFLLGGYVGFFRLVQGNKP